MEIKFINGINRVTGSCTWLREKNSDLQILVDCGMVQEGKNDDFYNNRPFPFNPKDIYAVFLTHSHLDHCGLIPRLYKEGFVGKIYCSEITAKLTKVMLEDASNYTSLFTKSDLMKIKYYTVDSKDNFKFRKGYKIETDFLYSFQRSSHILGSLSYTFFWKDTSGEFKNIFFSGDIGNRIKQDENNRFLKHLHLPDSRAEYLVLESTYGNSGDSNKVNHEDKNNIIKKKIEEFLLDKEAINLIIPVFSQNRLQEILFDLFNIIPTMNTRMGLHYRIENLEGWIKRKIVEEDIYNNTNILEEDKIYISENSTLNADGNLEFNTADERFKEILYKGLLNNFDIIVDTELGKRVMEIYGHHLLDKKQSKEGYTNKYYNEFNEDILDINLLKDYLIGKKVKLNEVNFTHKNNSQNIVKVLKKKIILTSSGMCDKGKILEYLDLIATGTSSWICLTGYQANNTNGYKLKKLMNNEYTEEEKNNFKIIGKNSSFKLNEIKMKIDDISSLYKGHITFDNLVKNYVFHNYDFNHINDNNRCQNTVIFLNHGEDSSRETIKKEIIENKNDYQTTKTRKISNVEIPIDSSIYDLNEGKWKTSSKNRLRKTAINTIEELIESTDDAIRLNAAKLILEYDL